MRLLSRASGLAKAMVLASTVVFTALVLVVNQAEEVEPIRLSVGEPAPQTFSATGPVSVVDEQATETAREEAIQGVEVRYTEDTQASAAVLASIQAFFTNARLAATPLEVPDEDPGDLTPPTTTSTTTTTTTTTLPEEDTTTTGAGGDTGDTTGEESTTTEETTTSTTTTTTSTTTTTTLPPPPRELQIAELRDLHPLVRTETIEALVDVLNDDYDREINDEQPVFRFVEDEALTLASERLEEGIRSTELEAVRSDLVTNPPPLILLRDLPETQRVEVEAAVADLVAVSLQGNWVRDDTATAEAQAEAAAAVPESTVVFQENQTIVRVGDVVSAVQLEAIESLGLLEPETAGPSLRAMAVVATLMVLLGAFFLWRVGGKYWRHPKLVLLFGILVVLAAVAARVPGWVTGSVVERGFLLPAALFGYLTASLFDSRVAVLMALPVTTFTALATGDLALVVYAAGAALAPIPLVSSVSSRAQLNAAVLLSAVFHAPLAATVAWYFNGSDTIWLSAVFGAASGLISGVAALGVLPFLAAVFGITTAQTLLDLTDRNHPALRRLEEEAPGTFNHSIMVGNLAGRAARAIEADVLLAQAMSYFHDLGKTTAPKYFVENQFGVSNPHDQLPPEESARLIRSHVSEGLKLAREFRLPPDVAQGIYTHHGTSLMRYFYHKALDLYGDEVNPSDYRHRGRKPQSKEMVIVMLSDACEAAARAMVQHEDPTSDSLRTLVEQVIAEKVEDGQLEESDVTFGELSRVKEAIVDALIGYYHTRIPYPGFPGRSAAPA